MTKIYLSDAGGRYCIAAREHATGSIHACAAISGILYALCGYLDNAARDGYMTLHRREMEPGRATLDFAGGTQAQTAFDLTAIGLMQTAKAYPDYVRVIHTLPAGENTGCSHGESTRG